MASAIEVVGENNSASETLLCDCLKLDLGSQVAAQNEVMEHSVRVHNRQMINVMPVHHPECLARSNRL